MKDMRIYNYFAALLLSASLLVSCSKGTGIEETVAPQPQEPEAETIKLPNITFGKPGTKAMLNDVDLKTNGSKIKVFDILSGYSGLSVEGWNPADPYIDDEVVYDGVEVWKYATNGVYPWTANGTHEFFGYLTYDKKSELNVTDLVTPTLSGKTLTVPAITFTTDSKQFDFLYSDLVSRDASRKDYSVVPLNFKHLFTALGIQVKNTSSVPVKVTGVKFNNLKNKNNASIAYASPSVVTLGTSEVSGSFLPSFEAFELTKDKTYDLLKKVANPEANSYFMLWPLTASDVESIEIEVDYSYYIEEVWEAQPTFKRHLSNLAWEPGKRNNYTLIFSDKRIDLTSIVLPWDYNEYDVDFADGSITGTEHLKFEDHPSSHVSVEGHTYTILDGDALRGTFKIQSPIGGTWLVGMKGDTEYFTITPTSGNIDKDVNNGYVSITVIPNTSLPRTEDKKIHFTFTVISSGRDINADSELNYDDIVVVLPRN